MTTPLSRPGSLEVLQPLVQPDEVDAFATTLARYREGKVAEKVFTEYRLRFGTYGQRQDGVQMQRIKIPMGRVTARQLEVLAEIAEEYADGISHVTTRQDIQIHFLKLEDAPAMFARLGDVGITCREACGNSVRNVTACAEAGVCAGAPFDVTPYAQATARFLLRHPDTQDMGRKFKISFSGCADKPCGLARMHDLGAVAKVRDGVEGFEVWVGGGLGPVPMQAKLLHDFIPATELLPTAQAITRVFARLGEKKIRSRARIKFLIEKLGFEAFARQVAEERGKLTEDPAWTDAFEEGARDVAEGPLKPPSTLDAAAIDAAGPGFRAFYENNVRSQAQSGYATVTLTLPLGDVTSDQLFGLADVCRAYVEDTIRFTADQNIVLRWVSLADLPALHADLVALDLARADGGTLANVTACPGTDSCKLGIASSRGLAGTLLERFANGLADLGARKDVSVKISGCPNACGQHHVAAIGLAGSSKRKGQSVAPVFQVFLGGTTENNADRFGATVAKVAARRAPEVVAHLTKLYDGEKEDGESFTGTMLRLGRARLAEELAPYADIPERDTAPELYRDNKQPWEYVRTVGVGECAGEVVSQAEFMLEDAERLAFEASLALEKGDAQLASTTAFEAMRAAADALLSTRGLLKSDGYDPVAEFEKHFTGEGAPFFPGTAAYIKKAAAENGSAPDAERLTRKLTETHLFVEEANVVYGKLAGAQVK
jgi:sulfite reductase (ferredoxin)